MSVFEVSTLCAPLAYHLTYKESRTASLDMHAVAAMNEMTWQRVLDWEALHAEHCGQPRLLRFRGRPDELR